jgi:cystathionine beta-lyase
MKPTDRNDTAAFASLGTPVWRASTVVFATLDQFVARRERLPDGFTYGTTGTPTQRALEQAIADLDEVAHCVVFPSGQAAICATLLTLLRAGDHVLMVDSAYGPARRFAGERLRALGVDVEFYPPRIGAAIGALIKPQTRLVWMESPGTMTMELQDVGAITAAARAQGVATGIDNTWASPLGFCAAAQGVDLVVHACTKYMGGHSDVLMGSVSTASESLYRALRDLQAGMGLAVSAEDCFLVERGLQTLQVRQQRQAASALVLAQRLLPHSMVKQVLYPPLPGSPDHPLWVRDHRLGGCTLSLQLQDAGFDAYRSLFAALKVFRLGASWGGVHSVAAFCPADELAARRHGEVSGPLVRLSIGLEEPQRLADDVLDALQCFASHR